MVCIREMVGVTSGKIRCGGIKKKQERPSHFVLMAIGSQQRFLSRTGTWPHNCFRKGSGETVTGKAEERGASEGPSPAGLAGRGPQQWRQGVGVGVGP